MSTNRINEWEANCKNFTPMFTENRVLKYRRGNHWVARDLRSWQDEEDDWYVYPLFRLGNQVCGVVCPYCGQVHIHTITALGYEGWRESLCGKGGRYHISEWEEAAEEILLEEIPSGFVNGKPVTWVQVKGWRV